MTPAPYYADDSVTLYLGDYGDLSDELYAVKADAVVVAEAS